MGDVMEFDMGDVGHRGRPPPRIAARLASGRGNIGARPPSGRADAKASEPSRGSTGPAKRPSSVTTDSLRSRRSGMGSDGEDNGARRGASFRRGSSDNEGAKPTRFSDENKFRLGQKIEGRYRGKGQWYKGRIIGANSDGTYDVRYEDGDEDLRLESSALKSSGDENFAVTSNSPRGGSRGDKGKDSYRIGERVEARLPGTTRWRAATIVDDHPNGTIDVRFTNGEEERKLDPSMVRKPQDLDDEGRRGGSAGSYVADRQSGNSRQPLIQSGDVIEARYRGGSKWYAGVVKREHSDGTFDIRYADGDEERGVDGNLVRLSDGGRNDSRGNALHNEPSNTGGSRAGSSYRVGEKVEARFGGRTRWFNATVERENRDGTYHLLYADGDEERAVEKELIRGTDGGGEGGENERRSRSRSPGRRVISGAASELALSAAHSSFRQGDNIEARYKRGRTWYAGIVVAVGRDGTYNIRYNDGDTENRVDPGLVRGIGLGSTDALASTVPGGQTEHDFAEGDNVEARFGGRSRWLMATVRQKHRDGTYRLFYEDGKEERSVEKSLIRRVERKTEERVPDTTKKHHIGDDIEARYKRGRKWYLGTIRAVNRDGTYDIRYKDGDIERDVEPSLVRSKGSASVDSLGSQTTSQAREADVRFNVGEKVEARFGGRSRWFKAVVERQNRNGTYHLLYEDGDEERAVGKNLIRRLSDGITATSGSKSLGGQKRDEIESDSELNRKHRVGDDVEARYRRGHKWFPGVVRAVNRDGTYDIRYKDGDEENDVEPSLVRRTDRASVDSLASSIDAPGGGRHRSFSQGTVVEARYQGRSRWLKGTVERKNRDGTYFLIYDDGDEERAVEKELIRLPLDRSSIRDAARRTMSRAGSDTDNHEIDRVAALRVGDAVEARYKRGQKWYPGVVRAANRGGTYDIRYRDGDTEYDVDASLVRSASTETMSTADAEGKNAVEYQEGDHIEAKFGGRSPWYKAKVARKNRDGTYHLIYVDGEEERAVDKSLMRTIGGDARDSKEGSRVGVGTSRFSETDADVGRKKQRRIGDDIEARYKKGKRWYPGVIRAVNHDGTYDIRYKDGDTERYVEPPFVRDKGEASTSSLESSDSGGFLEGDKVEARFGGRSRWFKATVERKNRDGTYFLRYIDGDEERAVEKELIRKMASAEGLATGNRSPGRRVLSGSVSDVESSIKSYLVGDRIEARYKRGRKWYPGVVRAVNRDGTYDIRYSDGDTERDVDAGLIRGMGTASANSLTTISTVGGEKTSDNSFVAGDKVEARFGGRSRWFKATVEKNNRDGTYRLLYADGDEERKVAKDLIRRIDSSSRSGSKSPGRRVVSGVDSDAERPGTSALREGNEIEARHGGGSKWYPGVIRAVNRDGTYDVRYDDGDSERSVEPRLVRGKGADRVNSRSVMIADGGKFEVGETVEARFGGHSRWFKATIARKNRDGTFHLLYADGDEEKAVEKRLIRKIESTRLTRGKDDSLDSIASVGNPVVYRAGDKVEARFGGRSRWYKATVERENRDGTYHLRYADGDEERAVDKYLIRKSEDQARTGETKARESPPRERSDGKLYHVGDDIEARYKRGRKWYPGVLRGVNRDGTYDIRYKDGDEEHNVEPSLVRRVGMAIVDSLSSIDTGNYSIGDKVEARFGGRSRWFKATVERKNRGGTYHLVYADGDEEKSVESNLIRKANSDNDRKRQSPNRHATKRDTPGGASSEAERDRDAMKRSELSTNLLFLNENVEARFAGGARWFPGRITRIHRNGTYDVMYSDGEQETHVPAKLVRQLVSGSDSGGSDGNAVRPGSRGHRGERHAHTVVAGDSVEARLRGRSTWHRGDVTRVHSDGTYDIRYRDGGEHEKRVDPEFVRHLPEGSIRGTSHRRQRDGATESSMSDSEDHQRRKSPKGRSKERRTSQDIHEAAGADAEAAATIVAHALRKAGKSVDQLTRKLERRRGCGATARGVERSALEDVLTGLGVNLATRQTRAIARKCEDLDLDGCVDPSALAALVVGQRGSRSSSTKRGSSSTHKRRDSRSASPRSRRHSTSTAGSEGSNDPNTSAGEHRRTREASRRRTSTFSPRGSSSDDVGGKLGRSDRSSSRTQRGRPKGGLKSVAETHRRRAAVTTSSERGGEGSSTFSEGSGVRGDHGDGLVSTEALKALRKLEGPAFDGSLRQAFENLAGSGRGGGVLTRSNLKRLLKSLRVTVDASVIGEIMGVVDSKGTGSCDLSSLTEAVLSGLEEKKVARIHASIRTQIFEPTGRSNKKQESKEAKAVCSAVSKAFAKMNHPRGSGLLRTGDLKRLLQQAGGTPSTQDVTILSERLDPNERGKIDQEAFVTWLTSGLDRFQTESRVFDQLSLLKEKTGNLEKIFKEFDRDRRGIVTKNDFLVALRRLGLVLTHGQANALAKEHRKDCTRFLKLRERLNSSEGESGNSESENSGRNSERQSRSRTRRSLSKAGRRGRADADDSSDENSDQSLVSIASGEESDEGNNGSSLMNMKIREALRDLFERTSSSTGRVRETFHAACGSDGSDEEEQEIAANREETKRFLRRLKLNLGEDERTTILNVIAGPLGNGTTGRRGRGADFETGGRGRARRLSRDKTGSSDGGSDPGGRVLYRDFLEVLLVEQESKEISKLHGRMSKDLARAAEKQSAAAGSGSGKNHKKNSLSSRPFSMAIKAFRRHDSEGLGFVKGSEFKQALERLGVGGLSAGEKSLLVRRFDPLEDGVVNYEIFCTWLSSGLDIARLKAKIGRLLSMVTARNGGKGGRSRGLAKRSKSPASWAVRGVFEAMDRKAEGVISQRDMKVALWKTLGLPLTEGDLRALFRLLDKDGTGMLDYEELLVLASNSRRGDTGDNSRADGGRRRSSLLSSLKKKGSALIRSGSPSKKRKINRKAGRDIDSGEDSDGKSNADSEGDSSENDSDRDSDDGKRKQGNRTRKKNREGKDKKRSDSSSPSKRNRLERDMMRLRASILQQSAAAAKCYHENNNGSDNEHDDDDETGVSTGGGKVDWLRPFEQKDHAGTGAVEHEDLKEVLIEAGVNLSSDDLEKLESRFVSADPAWAEESLATNKRGEAGLVDYDKFVRWLSEGGCLDDAILAKVQQHLKARLSKVMDLRSLFSEMSTGSFERSGKDNNRKTKLSRSRLARGLRHAGLPLDRAVVDQLVSAYSTARRTSGLSYANFHHMVHSKGLADSSAPMAGVTIDGGGDLAGTGTRRAGTLEQQIRSSLLETVEQAFAFYDEDNSNSIDTGELINIVRALGHDPTRAEERALLRKADADRNGILRYDEVQEAVMPFLLERVQSKRLTEGEMRAIFDAIDTERCGTIKRTEFEFMFCSELKLLSHHEAEALLSVLDRKRDGNVAWEELVGLFELIDDPEGEGVAALNPDLKEVVILALRKLQMGALPNVQEQLASFLGMPSTCRKSILAPLDKIKELSLQWVLMPKLDSRGCIQLQDMSVKVTTEVAEVEANKALPDAQVLVKTANLADVARMKSKRKDSNSSASRSLAATLGFKKRHFSPSRPAAVTELKGTKTRRRSAILGAGLMETTTTVIKRAQLQEVGAPTAEPARRGTGGDTSSGVLQVELSVKHAFGIPVARDSRLGDIKQRGMRGCLFYDAGEEIERDAGEQTSEYGEHFFGNTYKTLALQHPQREEQVDPFIQWLFPDSSEGERKFLIRTDFGGENPTEHQHHRRRKKNNSANFAASRENLYLLVELTCTVQTETGNYNSNNWGEGDKNSGGVVRGPLKNFRAGRAGRKRGQTGRGWGKSGNDSDDDSEKNNDGGSGSEDSRGSRDDNKGSDTTSTSENSSSGGDGYKKKDKNSTNHSRNRLLKGRRRGRSLPVSSSKRKRGRDNRRARTVSIRSKRSKSDRERRPKRGRNDSSTSSSASGRKESSSGSLSSRHERNESSSTNGSTSDGDDDSGRGRKLSTFDRKKKRKRKPKIGQRTEREGGAGWRRPFQRGGRNESKDKSRVGGDRGRRASRATRSRSTDDKDAQNGMRRNVGMVEVEMSCGWALIPFMELVETQEVKKVKYKLFGGTPFARMDIDEDEVMTRRYGWRALLKAMKVEGTHKESELEIKILPVHKLSKAKQDDIFRLPRNIVLSDTYVSLVRHYREYAANSLAKHSARGMGNARFGAVSASSEPALALFPQLAADPALMMALKNQWQIEIRKTRGGVRPAPGGGERLGATLAAGLAGVGINSGSPGNLEAAMSQAFENAVMQLWPAFCHIDAQRRTQSIGTESYEELEGRYKRIRQILASSDSFRGVTPTNTLASNRKSSAGVHDDHVLIAFSLKEVVFDAA